MQGESLEAAYSGTPPSPAGGRKEADHGAREASGSVRSLRALQQPQASLSVTDSRGLLKPSATPSFPSQPEGKIGLPRANPRGRLRSPS